MPDDILSYCPLKGLLDIEPLVAFDTDLCTSLKPKFHNDNVNKYITIRKWYIRSLIRL